MNAHPDQSAIQGGQAPLALSTLLTVVRRRLMVFVLCVVLVPLSALVFSLTQEKRYTAAASLLFRDPGLDQKLFGSTFLEPSTDPAREAATNTALVSLDAVAARTARALDGKLSTGGVSEEVKVAAEGQADIVSVSATDSDPRFAARLANTFAQEYLAFRRDADRSKVTEAQRLIRRQLRDLAPAERAGSRGRSLSDRGEQVKILASLQTGNAEIVDRAAVPTSASSPRTTRNVGIGVVLGLLLGIALALLLERLDRRLRDPREVEDLFSRPILGSVPQSAALAESGPASLAGREQEAFRMLRANLRYFNVDRSVQSVLVTSAAPGDGKSTVSWNLAYAAATAGEEVLLIEADLRHPSLVSSARGLSARVGLSTVLAGEADPARAVQQVPVASSSRGAQRESKMDILVAGPLPPNPGDLIESQRMLDVLLASEQRYGLVVIDTPPTPVVSDALPLLKKVSGVLVVARLGETTRGSLDYLHRQLTNLAAPVLGIVVNALKSDGSSYGYGGYGYGYGQRDDGAEVPIDSGASSSADGGQASVSSPAGVSRPKEVAAEPSRVAEAPRPASGREPDAGTAGPFDASSESSSGRQWNGGQAGDQRQPRERSGFLAASRAVRRAIDRRR